MYAFLFRSARKNWRNGDRKVAMLQVVVSAAYGAWIGRKIANTL